jgi:hypothetical protein
VQQLHAQRDTPRALLVRDAEVAEARLVRSASHLRPDARVQARKDAHADARREIDRLAAGDGDELLLGDAILVVQKPTALVRPDHDRTVCPGDALGAPEVVEVGVPDQDVVRLADVGGGDADRWRRGDAVDVGVEEDRRFADHEAEGRDAEPVEHEPHGIAIPCRSGAARGPDSRRGKPVEELDDAGRDEVLPHRRRADRPSGSGARAPRSRVADDRRTRGCSPGPLAPPGHRGRAGARSRAAPRRTGARGRRSPADCATDSRSAS